MMEFLTTGQQEDLPMPSQDYEPTGYRRPAPQTLRGVPSPPPASRGAPAPYRPYPAGAAQLGREPNLQFFGPKDFVPEVPHLVPRDFNGLQAVAPVRSESRIDEGELTGEPVRASNEYLQLVPKPRYKK